MGFHTKGGWTVTSAGLLLCCLFALIRHDLWSSPREFSRLICCGQSRTTVDALDLCLLSGHIFKNQFLLQSSRALEVSRNFHHIHQFSSIQNFPFGTEEKHMSGLWDLCLNVNKCISYRSKLKQYKIKLNVKLLFCSTCQRDDVHQWHVTILRKVLPHGLYNTQQWNFFYHQK